MGPVVRAAIIYVLLLVLLRLSGKRTLAQVTSFDFVLLLIIGEATQQALLSDDYSITNAAIVITTLVSLNVLISLLKQRFKPVERILEDIPLVIVADGKLLDERMQKARVDLEDILDAARESHGLESMDQIKHAVLERSGRISVIPRKRAG